MKMNENRKARVIAFYLPQFHPTPENDYYWGKGFTEWTNVGKAKPLFKGHNQPRVPADLGYYDLRLPEVREQQAKMAKEAGIEGFCYWHYWFGNGKMTLERPFQEVLESGKPDYPFCLGWANHSWSNKTWTKTSQFSKDMMIFEQCYPGVKDDIAHFEYVLKAFKDKRYICVDGKPLFLVFKPLEVPHMKSFIELWQKLAIENGLKGIYFVGIAHTASNYIYKYGLKIPRIPRTDETAMYCLQTLNLGFDAVNTRGLWRAEVLSKGAFLKVIYAGLKKIGFDFVEKYDYNKIIDNFYTEEEKKENIYPTILPQWDRTPRCGLKAPIYVNSTPSNFGKAIERVLKMIDEKKEEHKIMFLMSWNEWGEGNYVEPDLKYHDGYLKVLREKIVNK
ncbi:glycosyltransferase WbsX family protein [Bacteroides cellulosilyticus]|jgi:glycosyltransferase|uniref:glycosyltransferase WbsX family protein n=1 Tax=Bacteroides cellulosilyticus TaxID=246787 RepID=UPI0032C05B51